MTRIALALLAASVAAACAADTRSLEGADAAGAPPDVGLPRDAAAARDGGVAPDALAAVDVGGALDATAALDSGPPTGCFAADLTLETVTAQGGGRAHLATHALLGRSDGWILVYSSAGATSLAFLDVDGRVRAREQASVGPRARVVDLGEALLFTSDFEQQRIDIAGDRITRVYFTFGIDTSRAVARDGSATGNTVRAVSTPYLEGRPRVRVTDLEPDASERTGFRVRDALLAEGPELGYATAFQYFFAGPRLRLLGTGSLTSSTWRSLLVELGPLSTSRPMAWEIVDEAPWPRDTRDEIVGVTADGRVLTGRVEGDPPAYAAYLEPLPASTPPPVGALRVDGRPGALLEDDGRVAILTDDHLRAFRASDLAPLGELAFPASRAVAALHGRRAAVVREVGVGGAEASIVMRCVTVP